MPIIRWSCICFLAALVPAASLLGQTPKLEVADNGRFLTYPDGKPFVWIGDTNWFFARLPPPTIDSILNTRARQGFTIMFVSCREDLYNGEGPGRPGEPNEDWWAYLDAYIAKCAQRNMYVGITLGWWGLVRRHTEAELYAYGKWVGHRYRQADNVIWLTMGEAGSHARKDTLPRAKVEALVRGIREGDTGNKLLTIHADYQRGSSLTADGELSDFNNWQTSQWCCPDDLPRKGEQAWTVWEAIAHDYALRYDGRPKPTLDSEGWYEHNKDFCGNTAFFVRRRAYFTILAGGFGHTYGAGGIWDGLVEPEGCSGDALSALHYPGAESMSHLSRFLHGLGPAFLQLRPDQSLITAGQSDDYNFHLQAARTEDHSFALVYSPSDTPYTLEWEALDNPTLAMRWYDPREHVFGPLTRLDAGPSARLEQTFDPPGDAGSGHDWVLLIGQAEVLSDVTPK